MDIKTDGIGVVQKKRKIKKILTEKAIKKIEYCKERKKWKELLEENKEKRGKRRY